MKDLSKKLQELKRKGLISGSLSKLKLDDWIDIIELQLDPWKTAYQIFINKLSDYVSEKNRNVFQQDHREAYRMDPKNKNKIKSPASILDRILRTMEDNHPRIKIRKLEKIILHYMRGLDDIARCRILCNYNCDLERIDEDLRDEFRKSIIKSRILYRKDKRKDKRIEGGRSFLKGAHRAIHEYYECDVDRKPYIIEVQIMTFLQEAWNIKEHIIYEKIRRGQSETRINTIMDRFHALSGLLLIADEFADTTWQEYINSENKRM